MATKPKNGDGMALRTAAEVRRELADLGITVSEWARSMGYSPGVVYQVLAGRLRCLHGQAHDVAVALGLKRGSIGTVGDLSFSNHPRRQGNDD